MSKKGVIVKERWNARINLVAPRGLHPKTTRNTSVIDKWALLFVSMRENTHRRELCMSKRMLEKKKQKHHLDEELALCGGRGKMSKSLRKYGFTLDLDWMLSESGAIQSEYLNNCIYREGNLE